MAHYSPGECQLSKAGAKRGVPGGACGQKCREEPSVVLATTQLQCLFLPKPALSRQHQETPNQGSDCGTKAVGYRRMAPPLRPWGLLALSHIVLFMAPSRCAPGFYHRGWLRLMKEGNLCGPCKPDLCPPTPPSCPAGTVLDDCGCCEECANVEGQMCDPDGSQKFYGRCGEGLECRRKTPTQSAEPQCVCSLSHVVCGSDNRTYQSECQLREATHRDVSGLLHLQRQGPCATAPQISRPPRDLQMQAGGDVTFGCEVTAYPVAHLDWKRKGKETFLPGDDVNVSVQVRGGPRHHGITSWLQIHSVKKSDEGVYVCYTRNAYGESFASAELQVIDGGPSRPVMKTIISSRISSLLQIEDDEDYDEDTEGGDDDGDPESGIVSP
ncbi:kazal-type serine protease inhibitor domain-containing protein 1-like [Erpetoichthys calabaricus]|uniref:kazal-type serine protease inhibitor domain-containing protein 1-like n=1 Tax=Erpetoichthys calabaricus TaxID=27687 RepID=UPI002234CD33|nr:kazal-type serine protease inhibitor domain-containing protein 1-like [Erpetoichthys calabaricus]